MNYFFGGNGSSIPSAKTSAPGTRVLVGVVKFSFLVSTGLSAVQEEVKRIAAKQPIANTSFFIKKCLKKLENNLAWQHPLWSTYFLEKLGISCSGLLRVTLLYRQIFPHSQ